MNGSGTSRGLHVGGVALSHRIEEARWLMSWIRQMEHRRHVSMVTGALMSWVWYGTREAVWSGTSAETTTWA